MQRLEDRVIIGQVLLDAPPVDAAGFQTYMIASAGATFDDEQVRTYVAAADVDADAALTAHLRDNVKTALANGCPEVKVGKMAAPIETDTDDKLSLIEAADSDFFALTLDTESAATLGDKNTALTAAAAWAEARNIFHTFQTADPDSITGNPSIFDTLGALGYERTGGVYSTLDEGEERQTVYAWTGRALSFDIDTLSNPWKLIISGAPPAALTAGQADELTNSNGNYAAPYGPSTVVSPGSNLQGRPIYQIVSQLWYLARTNESFIQLALDYMSRGQKFPLNEDGQAAGAAILDAIGQIGLDTQHFNNQEPAVALPITQDDRNNQRLRFTKRIQILDSVIEIRWTAVLQRSPL